MKSLIKVSEIHDGLLKINRHRVIYYKKAIGKIRELNLKMFLNEMLEGRRIGSVQIREMATPGSGVVSSPIKRSKFYRFRMKVKTIIHNAYELE